MPTKKELGQIWTGPTTGNPKPIIYLSGSYDLHPRILAELRFCCLSYVDHAKFDCHPEYLGMFRERGVRCFLDSGAFTYQMQAHKKGRPLDRAAADVVIDQYIDWVYKVDFLFDFLVTFDYVRRPDEVLWATRKIERRGLHPIPVFHQQTPLDALQALIDKGYGLIGIGGMIPRTKHIIPVLDQIFNITEKRGVRLHGFGVGSKELITYPWFSVDSTSWLQAGRFGFVHSVSKDPTKWLGEKVGTSPQRVSAGQVCADKSLTVGEARAVRLAANIRFWNDLMDRLSRDHRDIKLKQPLF